MNGVRDMVARKEIVYNYEEDERMVIPVMAALSRKILKEADVIEWLDKFMPLAQEQEPFPSVATPISSSFKSRGKWFILNYL